MTHDDTQSDAPSPSDLDRKLRKARAAVRTWLRAEAARDAAIAARKKALREYAEAGLRAGLRPVDMAREVEMLDEEHERDHLSLFRGDVVDELRAARMRRREGT